MKNFDDCIANIPLNLKLLLNLYITLKFIYVLDLQILPIIPIMLNKY